MTRQSALIRSGTGEDAIFLDKVEPIVYERPWGSPVFLSCPYACAEKFVWMSGERNLTEVDENWGVLMLANITNSAKYSCIPDGIWQLTQTFSVIAVGKLIASFFVICTKKKNVGLHGLVTN